MVLWSNSTHNKQASRKRKRKKRFCVTENAEWCHNTQSSSPIPSPFIHDYLFSPTETHPWSSSIRLSYHLGEDLHLGTQNTHILTLPAPGIHPGTFANVWAGHVGVTGESIPRILGNSHPSKFLIYKYDLCSFVMIHWTNSGCCVLLCELLVCVGSSTRHKIYYCVGSHL